MDDFGKLKMWKMSRHVLLVITENDKITTYMY